MAGTEPQMFLNQYAWSEKLTSEAEKMRVELTSPWKERLEDSRRQILVQGLIQRKRDDISISDEDVKKYFDANKDNFRQANAKVIFVSRASYSANLADGVVKTPDPLEAKRKADKVAKLAREGGDFVALAKEHSDDRATAEKSADLPYSIRSGSSEIPQNIREPIMKAKTGDIIGPIEHETGFYLFKVTSSGMSSLREAKQDIVRNLKEAEVKRWMDELRTKASATLDHKAFWDTFVATNKLALGKKAEQKDQEPSK